MTAKERETLNEKIMRQCFGKKEYIDENARRTAQVTFKVWYEKMYPSNVKYTREAVRAALSTLVNAPVTAHGRMIGEIKRITKVVWRDKEKCCEITVEVNLWNADACVAVKSVMEETVNDFRFTKLELCNG